MRIESITNNHREKIVSSMDKKLCSSEGGQQPFNLLEPFKVSPTLNPFVKLTQTFPALLTCLKRGHIIDNHSIQNDIITASKGWFEHSLTYPN